jgi:hypothetical protein
MKKWGPLKQHIIVAFLAIAVSVWGAFSYLNFSKQLFKETYVAKQVMRLPASLDDAHRFPNDEYIAKVQPLLASRCVACHSCYEAPCLMHLTSYEGLQRGLTKNERFGLVEDLPPNRLKDAPIYKGLNNTPKWNQPEWLHREFYPVFQLGDNGKLDLKNSLFSMALEKGKNHTQNFSLNADDYPSGHTCSQSTEELAEAHQLYPMMGMPYALPALEESEYKILNDWMKKGARGPTNETRKVWNEPSQPETVNKFEKFFNGATPKAKLVTRYIYEHSYFAHIHFKGTPHDEFYEIIRASNAIGDPREIVTEMANDPIRTNFVYRLRRVHEVIARKTHNVWDLNEQDLNEWRNLFFESSWPDEDKIVEFDTGLSGKDRKNPMVYFKIIPSKVRYAFMVRNADMLIGEVVRSPSCTGKVATLAIKDHFWVFFLSIKGNEKFEKVNHQAPQSLKEVITNTVKQKIFNEKIPKNEVPTFNEQDLDTNMSLSIFRHFTTVTVNKGLWGGDPQNIWVFDYDNYEDLYYNLVVNYKPWLAATHQVLTWEHMVKNRKIAEKRFIDFFLEGDSQCKNCARWVWERWEKGVLKRTGQEEIKMNDAVKRAQNKLHSVMARDVSSEVDELNSYTRKASQYSKSEIGEWENQMLALTHKMNKVRYKDFPDLMYIKLSDENGKENIYSLIVDRTYKTNNNIAAGIINQNMVFVPEANRIVIIKGILGNHPNLIFNLKREDAADFIDKLKLIQSLQDWVDFRSSFALKRNDPQFWKVYDDILEWQFKHDSLNAGIIDLNLYQMFE